MTHPHTPGDGDPARQQQQSWPDPQQPGPSAPQPGWPGDPRQSWPDPGQQGRPAGGQQSWPASATPPPPPPPGGGGGKAAVVVGLVVLLIMTMVGAGGWWWYSSGSASASPGLTDYRDRSDMLQPGHQSGDIEYEVNPPVGGKHNGVWQNCQGAVYDQPIADEHAVHSMEHGAVWITYRPGLDRSEIDKLAQRVRDRDYLMLSPHKALDQAISLQAWGLQLKTDSAEDPAIDEFITKHRMNAGPEKGATCAEGVTETGDTPRDP